MTSSPDVHMLTGPYAVDALPEDERDEFEQHLTYCAACRTEVDELRQAAIKLATEVAIAPPPGLRAKVLESVSQVRQLHPLIESEPDTTPLTLRGRFGRWSVLTLAAAAVVVALSGGVAIDQYRDNGATRRDSNQVSALLAEPDARTIHGNVNGGQATVVTSAHRDAAVVVLTGLRPLTAGKKYQMWLMDAARGAHSIGLVDGGSAELTRVVTGGVNRNVAFGVTVEPEGGSAQPTQPVGAVVSLV